jgi:hypothetical protein
LVILNRAEFSKDRFDFLVSFMRLYNFANYSNSELGT